MSNLNALGLGGRRLRPGGETVCEQVMPHRPLKRILAFRGQSIDDVVNNPIVKSEIRGYWKLYHQIMRHSEFVDLEAQWNPLGMRT